MTNNVSFGMTPFAIESVILPNKASAVLAERVTSPLNVPEKSRFGVIVSSLNVATLNTVSFKNLFYGAQNETYNDRKDVKWWNALSAKELRV